MRKLLLVIFTICLFSLPLLADGPYHHYENESNDIPPLSDSIPIGDTIVAVNGITGDNQDWFDYCVYLGNHWDTIIVTIYSATYGPALYVDVCTENPAVVQHTLNGIGDSFSYVVANEARHYICVYSMVPDNNYTVIIENQDEATLPVVLSSFAGTFSSSFVGIQWTTQTETELSGYNVLRNETNDLGSALQVNSNIIPSTNTSTTHDYSYRDQEIAFNTTYYYWLQSVNMDGTCEHYGPVTVNTTTPEGNETPEIVVNSGMDPAYPNPFGNETNIKFRLNSDMLAKLDIYNLKGEKVRSIFAGELIKGTHTYKWDGRNSRGETVSSGLYMGRLTTPTGIFSSKLYLFK